MSKEELLKVLENVEAAVIHNAIREKMDSLIIPEVKWQEVTNALYNEVGPDGWQDEWDY
jgi:hypothetical protein